MGAGCVSKGDGAGGARAGGVTALSWLVHRKPHPLCSLPCAQVVRALEHLHSKLSVIHRGQCPPGHQGGPQAAPRAWSQPVLRGRPLPPERSLLSSGRERRDVLLGQW